MEEIPACAERGRGSIATSSSEWSLDAMMFKMFDLIH
jgi:hypothetical protein